MKDYEIFIYEEEGLVNPFSEARMDASLMPLLLGEKWLFSQK